MVLVSNTQIAALRKIGDRGLVSKATILRSVQVESDFGSEGLWATVELEVPCWVRATKAPDNLTDVAYREALVNTFRVHFKVGVDVLEGDRLMVDDSTFDVISLNNENTYRIFTTATVKKVI